jgi:hypothetical protein
MPLYRSFVSATSNAAVSTEDSFIDVVAAAASRLRIKRVVVSCATAAQDGVLTVRCLRKSASGAGGVAGVAATNGPFRVDSGSRATSATLTVKSAATAFAVGTITDELENVTVNTRSLRERVAFAPEEEWYIAGGAIFGVNLLCTIVSLVFLVNVVADD